MTHPDFALAGQTAWPDPTAPGRGPVPEARTEISAGFLVGITRDCLARVSPTARVVHRHILTSFATLGRAPTRTELAGTGVDGIEAVLRELHDRDVVRLGDDGAVRAAYPFSAVPTAHTVAIDGGATVYAMCAIDALGMAKMLRRDIMITSTDPGSGERIAVSIHNGRIGWTPAQAVVLIGSDAGACCSAAADRSCHVMNFFAGEDAARTWLREHPHIQGTLLTQQEALRMGIELFGELLA